MPHSARLRKLFLILFFCLCFGAGRLAARSVPQSAPASSILRPEAANWGLSFQEEGKTPVGNASISELLPYHAFYAQDTEDKVIYLTFDCGYENGNTPAILDALKKHQVSATFFTVGTFLESEPDLVKRMIAEGHTVGNHTWHHPDMSAISTRESFSEELNSTGRLRANTAQRTCRWQRILAILLFSGALPMWTGTRITNLPEKKPLTNFWDGYTPEPSYCCIIPLPPTLRSWMNC